MPSREATAQRACPQREATAHRAYPRGATWSAKNLSLGIHTWPGDGAHRHSMCAGCSGNEPPVPGFHTSDIWWTPESCSRPTRLHEPLAPRFRIPDSWRALSRKSRGHPKSRWGHETSHWRSKDQDLVSGEQEEREEEYVEHSGEGRKRGVGEGEGGHRSSEGEEGDEKRE